MRKICGLFFVTMLASLVFFGCSSSLFREKSPEEQYADSLNEYLVSFSDCANALADSMEKISDKSEMPTEAELDDILNCGEKLSSVCAKIQSLKAPKKYSEAQSKLNEAMQTYAQALQKCSELLDFYRELGEKFREYKDPTKGGTELRKQADALYSEFALLLQQATAQFNTAQAEFN